MSNTHLLAALLAASIHLFFLLEQAEKKKKRLFIISHLAFGVCLLLPSLYFVLPPSDGEMNISFLTKGMSIGQLSVIAQIPVRAFIPVPAWWVQDFWNTQFLIEASKQYGYLKFIDPFISLGLILLVLYILSNNRKACTLFIVNLIFSAVVSCIFSLSTTRYVGYVFISFIVSCWLYCYENPMPLFKQKIIAALLVIQIIAGLYAAEQEINRPFSKLYMVGSLMKEVPSNQQIVTDYWALNAVSTYKDQALYCIDLRRKVSFIVWGADMKELNENPYRYYSGANVFFTQQHVNQVYMISTGSPAILKNIDSLFFSKYDVQLIDERIGAIEKGSNIYLYHISKF